MKYSIKYYKGCSCLRDADELILKFNEPSPELIDFINNQAGTWQRIVLDASDYIACDIGENMELFKEANELLNGNFAIKLDNSMFRGICNEFKENDIKFFFYNKNLTLDDIRNLVEFGVSDVYVTNELAFNMEKIATYCHRYDVNVRTLPNVAQDRWNSIPNYKEENEITKFFIRPEDLYLYEGYVDFIEFFVESVEDLPKQETFYKIYKTDGFWKDNLSVIISGLKTNINNTFILPIFGETRLKCNKRCDYGECNLCPLFVKLSKNIEEKI